ncbi:hypothetical protein [Haloglomus litoreum]|uniref:hypothetical protein n=1 Tax=Haloglomus litoreum TaxID=3034026 RepID=UPI0023E80C2D|nr:hypothetical protein [Haloglomus sp. DT116]
MRDYPPVPSLADVASDHLQGHVWVHEWLDAAAVRFAVASAGYLRFGDAERTFEEVPPTLGYAGRFIERAFDLGAYLDTVDEPARYTFAGAATHHRSIDYDWDRLPAVMGTAIWDGHEERWLPPDRAQQVFERLGPPPVTVVERERSVDQRPLAGYDLPASAWYDGPAAGVTFVDKRGHRVRLMAADVPDEPPTVRVETDGATGLAEQFVTDDLVATRAAALEERGESVAFDPLFEAVLDRVTRANHGALFRGVTDTGAVDIDWGAFRGTVAERVRRWLETTE